jgi:hypothetical protein
MRNVSDKICREIKTQISCPVTFCPENLVVFEIMWKNVVDPDTLQMAVRRICFVCWITKGTNTHSEYVILIALPLQQWFEELASMLRYTCIVSLVMFLANKNQQTH